LAVLEKLRFWQVIRYSRLSFPTSLTNPRKSATCTLARRDWNDYLILIPKNFHPKRTVEFDTN
jgi:hypothetical protein